MNSLAILLIHGFSGKSQDLGLLAEGLRTVFGPDSVHLLSLPGHADGKEVDRFDLDQLRREIISQLEELKREHETLVVVGHSTGGSLLLDALASIAMTPDLLVLAAVPYSVTLEYLDRWQKHRQGQQPLSLTTVSGLVKLINDLARRDVVPACPVLLLQGNTDQLVLPSEAHLWKQRLGYDVRLLEIPGASHQLFTGMAGATATKAICTEINSLLAKTVEHSTFARQLCEAEPEAENFLAKNRGVLRHIAMAPSGMRLQEKEVVLPERVSWEPVFANIEVTTYCNLSCRHCARTHLQLVAQHMSIKQFEQVLDKLPSAYRLTLVGLGEPLLHPHLVELIALAKKRERRVGLVTNAQLLTPEKAERIIEAGVDSIAFSLDAADSQLLTELRTGSNLARIEKNIRTFCARAADSGRNISRAVFCAVSAASFSGLQALIDKVSELGVHVLMLSDLNFQYNQPDGLSRTMDDQLQKQLRRTIAHGFSKKLPILGVRALEDFGLAQRYQQALLLPVQQLYQRSDRRRYCVSPWQTLSVNVAGDVCFCDCQPEKQLGNLFQQDLISIWNGKTMRDMRRQLYSDYPSPECSICPRL